MKKLILNWSVEIASLINHTNLSTTWRLPCSHCRNAQGYCRDWAGGGGGGGERIAGVQIFQSFVLVKKLAWKGLLRNQVLIKIEFGNHWEHGNSNLMMSNCLVVLPDLCFSAVGFRGKLRSHVVSGSWDCELYFVVIPQLIAQLKAEVQRLKDELAMASGQEYTGELTVDEMDR